MVFQLILLFIFGTSCCIALGMVLVPRQMGIGVTGPALDPKGNSIVGIELPASLSRTLNPSIFWLYVFVCLHTGMGNLFAAVRKHRKQPGPAPAY